MSKSSKMSGPIRHVHLVATEPSSAIVLSETEYELLIVALGEYKYLHSSCFVPVSLSEEAVATFDSLLTHLRSSYSELSSKK